MCTRQGENTPEEKQYTQLPVSSIRSMAEAGNHYNLSDDVLSFLTDNANCFVRQMLQSASQFMRHSHRNKLTTADVDKAVQWSDIPSMSGYKTSEPVSSAPVESGVDLVELATTSEELELTSPCLTGQWLTADETPKPEHSTSECLLSQPSTSRGIISTVNFGPAREIPQVVSQPLINYFRYITKAALSSDLQQQMTALNNLSSNDRIFPVLSYLTEFVSNGVKLYKHDINQLTKLLQIVKALIINPSVYVGCVPHLTSLVESLLYCILEPLGDIRDVNNDHWVLRDTASCLLERLFSTCVIPVNHVYIRTIGILKKTFADRKKPLFAHYGAVNAIVAFGANAIELLLYPHLSTYMAHLEMTDAVNNVNAQMVFGALQRACEIMLRVRMEMEPAEFRNETVLTKTNSDVVDDPSSISDTVLNPNGPLTEGLFEVKSSHDLYKEFFGYFGESFAVRLPMFKVDISCIPQKKNSMKQGSASEVTPTEHCDGSDKSDKKCFGNTTDSEGACVQVHEQESGKFHGDQHEEFAELECREVCSKGEDPEVISGDNGEKQDCDPEGVDVNEEDQHCNKSCSKEGEADEDLKGSCNVQCEKGEDVGAVSFDENLDKEDEIDGIGSDGKESTYSDSGEEHFVGEGSSDGD